MPIDWGNKDEIRKALLQISLFLLAYEMLKSSIVGGVKDFFLTGFQGKTLTYDDDYAKKVLKKHKSHFMASLIFLRELDAITEDEMTRIGSLRELRNDIAHNTPSLVENLPSGIYEKVIEANMYLHKIDNFWGTIEVDCDPDYLDKNVDYEGITSLRALMMQHVARLFDELRDNPIDGMSGEGETTH